MQTEKKLIQHNKRNQNFTGFKYLSNNIFELFAIQHQKLKNTYQID